MFLSLVGCWKLLDAVCCYMLLEVGCLVSSKSMRTQPYACEEGVVRCCWMVLGGWMLLNVVGWCWMVLDVVRWCWMVG